MAYSCPRCSKPVKRSAGGTRMFGLAGALISMACAGFECPDCGKIPRSEFPPEARSRMMMASLALVGGALLLIALVIVIVIALRE